MEMPLCALQTISGGMADVCTHAWMMTRRTHVLFLRRLRSLSYHILHVGLLSGPCAAPTHVFHINNLLGWLETRLARGSVR